MTLQTCIESIMLKGGGKFLIQVNKVKLRREGRLAAKYTCPEEAFNKAKSTLTKFGLH